MIFLNEILGSGLQTHSRGMGSNFLTNWITKGRRCLKGSQNNNRVGEMAHWLGAFVQSGEPDCRDPAPKLGVLGTSPGLCVYTLTDASIS